MAGIRITGSFVTNDPNDTYALLEDKYLLGGFRSVENLEDRDNIPLERRKWGMLVYVNENQTIYVLQQDNNSNDLTDNLNWKAVSENGTDIKIPAAKVISLDNNISLSSGLPVIDNVQVHENDVVVVFAQNNDVENGLYIAHENKEWERVYFLENQHVAGKFFIVYDGCKYKSTIHIFTNTDYNDTVGIHGLHTKVIGLQVKRITERFLLTQQDVSNRYITLSNMPYDIEEVFVYLNGLLMDHLEDGDIIIEANRITFNCPINLNDKVIVKYTYLPSCE